ncbi:MAG: hypothetical protein LBI67_12010 [Treponema sp.]|jgi:hypothetical protein|nr:hypothetical protein [Treponema sp.]
MLITNFAAGELSEDIFGRTDLPQYFQGVSHLENFDVVPTGGIIRRNGLRRITALPEEGRIIPFILDRVNHLLLFLTPGKIRVIYNGVIRDTVESSEELSLYATMAEINGVHYAQNKTDLILAHPNYPPLNVMYLGENNDGEIKISVVKFQFVKDVEIIADDQIDTQPFEETDDIEIENPGSVTFFNSRLVFTGSGQRIYFSAVNKINSFATYKKYLTEQREYITVEAEITNGSPYLTLTNALELSKFLFGYDRYYIDSRYFSAEARIESIIYPRIKMTENASIGNELQPVELDQMNEMIDRFNGENGNLKKIVLGFASFIARHRYQWSHENTVYNSGSAQYLVYLTFGLSTATAFMPGGTISVRVHTPEGRDYNVLYQVPAWTYTYTLPEDAAEKTLYDPEFLDKQLTGIINQLNYKYPQGYSLGCNAFKYIPDYSLVEAWKKHIDETMSYLFRDETLYGYPGTILQKAAQKTEEGITGYIPFYSRKIIEDRTVSPDDGFSFEIASDMSDSIKWIGQNKNLLVGTETGEWVIPAGVNATNIQAVLNSRYGSFGIQGTAIGDAFCFIQTGGKSIVEYYIPQQDTNFRANNMAMLSKNMLNESGVFDFDFASAPYTKIFISREDGIVAVLLYERLTGTFAWGRITTGGDTRGYIKSIAVLPGDGRDEVYFNVERRGKHFLERLDGRDEVYLDGFHEGPPDPGEIRVGKYSGFPYESRARSMPVLANDRMRNNIIKNLSVRFQNSFFPGVKSITGVDREVKTDTITRNEPYSGIVRIPFPGQHDEDVFFEFVHDKPTRCHILAVNAEAN